MKTKKLMLAALSAVLIMALVPFFTSCSKEEDEMIETADEISMTKEQIAAESMMDDMSRMAEDATDVAMDSLQGPGGGPKPPNWGPCATVSIVPFDSITWPKTITVDFGPVNCLCNDGKYRRGQIISVVTAPPHDSLSTRTVTPVNYFVNDHKVEGTRTFTNQGHINGKLTLSSSLVNGKITKPNGDFSTMNAQHTRVFEAGESTPFPAVYDDVWLVSGSRTGTMFNGDSYSMTITTALEVPRACSWIVSGVKEMQRTNKPLRVVDFGNGNCDNIATVTVNGVSHTIYLP